MQVQWHPLRRSPPSAEKASPSSNAWGDAAILCHPRHGHRAAGELSPQARRSVVTTRSATLGAGPRREWSLRRRWEARGLRPRTWSSAWRCSWRCSKATGQPTAAAASQEAVGPPAKGAGPEASTIVTLIESCEEPPPSSPTEIKVQDF